ncbi:MAG: hypothetical protein AAF743_08435, partial [Planctomycetota bacterium]
MTITKQIPYAIPAASDVGIRLRERTPIRFTPTLGRDLVFDEKEPCAMSIVNPQTLAQMPVRPTS